MEFCHKFISILLIAKLCIVKSTILFLVKISDLFLKVKANSWKH